ncbi:MAG TPA: hypothetical protein VK422_14280 [Pyrinomonadaceae bacterium]|nr:hypothetical protein [Pyrinomonadaceae bacterium]
MKSRCLSLTAPTAPLAMLAALVLLLLAPGGARAQKVGGGSPRRPNPPPRETQAPSIGERMRIMREMQREAARPRGVSLLRLPMEQIAEDFERLQAVNNRMLGAVMPAAEPDYGLIAGSAAEMKKRASRLKSNLPLPRPEKDSEAREPYAPPADGAGMKRALMRLDRALMSFVSNPVFKNTDVLNAWEGARAGRDLDEVIELSRLISRDAERMRKGGKP